MHIGKELGELKCMSRGLFMTDDPGALLQMSDGSYMFGKFVRDLPGDRWTMKRIKMENHNTRDICTELSNVKDKDIATLKTFT